MIVELHMIQNFAPSCLNRDDTNSPKECQFGGYRRARISSQCIKRAIREEFKNSLDWPPEYMATRSRLFVDKLADKLTSRGKNLDEAQVAAAKTLQSMGLGVNNGQSEYLLYLGEKELTSIAETVLERWQEFDSLAIDTSDKGGEKKATKKASNLGEALKQLLDGGKAADLALFGRMLADLPEKNVDAACQVAHAISTHKVGVEFDFYTAVDDLQPKQEAGAGMMGTVEFNSACYYRYANVNLVQLRENLGGDEELSLKTVGAFIRASVSAIPTGKQTSMAAPNPPEFIMAVVRDFGVWSLANAFARPVWPGSNGSLVGQSISALVNYWNRLVKVYGNSGIQAVPALAVGEADLSTFTPVENIDKLVEEVLQALRLPSQKGA
jgi:CRISPR system Cascade subunit CasC